VAVTRFTIVHFAAERAMKSNPHTFLPERTPIATRRWSPALSEGSLGHDPDDPGGPAS
jgi:hypothetical protein